MRVAWSELVTELVTQSYIASGYFIKEPLLEIRYEAMDTPVRFRSWSGHGEREVFLGYDRKHARVNECPITTKISY